MSFEPDLFLFLTNAIMITLKEKNFNQNVNKYFKYDDSCSFNAFTCPSCGSIGSLIKHGFYDRKIKINNIIRILTVLRIKCKNYGKTHAALPSFFLFSISIIINQYSFAFHK